MHFEKNTVYHIYNQGNNRQPIFFKEENYLFFLRKMQEYVLPYGDFLCYYLMPNHFHWLVYVRELEIPVRREAVTETHSLIGTENPTASRTFNESIAILLRSYTRAINKQEDRTGSLFRKETKAKDGWEDPEMPIVIPKYGDMRPHWELYGNHCLHYIHNNPVKSKLVSRAEDWEYSSAKDFAGLRNGNLCNLPLAKQLLYL